MPCGLPEPDEQPKQPDPLVLAFLQGAKWWEWRIRNATMWASDQQQAMNKGQDMLNEGRLGKLSDEQPKQEPQEPIALPTEYQCVVCGCRNHRPVVGMTSLAWIKSVVTWCQEHREKHRAEATKEDQ